MEQGETNKMLRNMGWIFSLWACQKIFTSEIRGFSSSEYFSFVHLFIFHFSLTSFFPCIICWQDYSSAQVWRPFLHISSSCLGFEFNFCAFDFWVFTVLKFLISSVWLPLITSVSSVSESLPLRLKTSIRWFFLILYLIWVLADTQSLV